MLYTLQLLTLECMQAHLPDGDLVDVYVNGALVWSCAKASCRMTPAEHANADGTVRHVSEVDFTNARLQINPCVPHNQWVTMGGGYHPENFIIMHTDADICLLVVGSDPAAPPVKSLHLHDAPPEDIREGRCHFTWEGSAYRLRFRVMAEQRALMY